MITLTTYQQRVLESMGEDDVSSLCFKGIEEIDGANDFQNYNMEYTQQMQLVNWGLCVDRTKDAKLKRSLSSYEKEWGRKITVVGLTEESKIMWKRITGRKVQ